MSIYKCFHLYSYIYIQSPQTFFLSYSYRIPVTPPSHPPTGILHLKQEQPSNLAHCGDASQGRKCIFVCCILYRSWDSPDGWGEGWKERKTNTDIVELGLGGQSFLMEKPQHSAPNTSTSTQHPAPAPSTSTQNPAPSTCTSWFMI